MTDLEQQALMGDRQAQEECTRQGIVVACPHCWKRVKRSVSGMLFYCPECHYGAAFHSDVVSKEEALTKWNSRPALPTVHAKWEKRLIDGKEKSCCTRCGEPNKQYEPPYCPHCGAKMDSEG